MGGLRPGVEGTVYVRIGSLPLRQDVRGMKGGIGRGFDKVLCNVGKTGHNDGEARAI